MTDPRVTELLELAASEGFTLPMPPRTIIYFEDHGCTVDLASGVVTRMGTVGTPTPSGKAISHLLAHEVGVVAL